MFRLVKTICVFEIEKANNFAEAEKLFKEYAFHHILDNDLQILQITVGS